MIRSDVRNIVEPIPRRTVISSSSCSRVGKPAGFGSSRAFGSPVPRVGRSLSSTSVPPNPPAGGRGHLATIGQPYVISRSPPFLAAPRRVQRRLRVASWRGRAANVTRPAHWTSHDPAAIPPSRSVRRRVQAISLLATPSPGTTGSAGCGRGRSRPRARRRHRRRHVGS
jgi:hypothetical protein